MTDVPAPDNPRGLLASHRALTRRVLAAQRGTWFPLVLLGVLTLGAIPVTRFGHRFTSCRNVPTPAGPGRVCSVTSTWLLAYWIIALVLAYAAIAWFYVRRARRRGVGTPVRPYALAGIGIAALVTAVGLWIAYDPPGILSTFATLHLNPGSRGPILLLRLVGTPVSAVGLALLVLSRVERNPALLLFTVVYLTIVLARVTFGWSTTPPAPELGIIGSPWFFLPNLVIPGGLLLLGGLGFALAQRRRQRAS